MVLIRNSLIVGIALLFCTGCIPADSDPITVNQGFTYTAVGDDGIVGQADRVQIRMSLSADSLINDWAACEIIYELPESVLPLVATSIQTTPVIMTGVPYYFAIKTADEVPNWSGVSNVWSKTYADVTPPSPITDFQGI